MWGAVQGKSWAGKYESDNLWGHKAGVKALKLLPSHGVLLTGEGCLGGSGFRVLLGLHTTPQGPSKQCSRAAMAGSKRGVWVV